MTEHHVKSWKHLYWPIAHGLKTHDLRINDRNYKVGDILILEEYDIEAGEYTGNSTKVQVTYITSNQFPCAFSSAVLPKDYAILSIKLVDPPIQTI